MCCRYVLDVTEQELSELIEEAEVSPLLNRFRKKEAGIFVRSGEVRPTNIVPAIATSRTGTQAVFPMRWGFTVEGRRAPLVNARFETAAEKPSFRAAWGAHRCVLPASYYYEWQHLPAAGAGTVTTKYAIRPRESAVTWLCGLYRIENGLPVFVVLTGPASEDLVHIHERMPLILPKEAVRAWIDPNVRAEDLLAQRLIRFAAKPAG